VGETHIRRWCRKVGGCNGKRNNRVAIVMEGRKKRRGFEQFAGGLTTWGKAGCWDKEKTYRAYLVGKKRRKECNIRETNRGTKKQKREDRWDCKKCLQHGWGGEHKANISVKSR